MALLAVTLILAYAFGAVPTGLLVGRLLGTRDVRDHGSSSSGATNVLRVQGWKAGLAVALIDLTKGWIAVAWLPGLLRDTPSAGATWLAPAVGIAAAVGHVWPFGFGFRGGKGVATTGGAVLAISPPAFAVALGLFTLVVAASRRVSLGSLVGAASLAPLLWLFAREEHGWPLAYGSVCFGLIVFTHRVNIGRLIAGSEPSIGS